MQQDTTVLIIGAGPAGLAVAAGLHQKGIDYIILEKATAVAQSWRNHYDRLHLHTVRDLSNLPAMPFPDTYPQFVHKSDLILYYEAYAKAFDIVPRYGHNVVQINRVSANKWEVHCDNGQFFNCLKVVLCAGMNRIPFRPHFHNEELFEGQILHSAVYKNTQPYQNKKVLVVGMGNSGSEIALDFAEQGVDVNISVRGAVNIVPNVFLGSPTQLTALKLAKLPNWLNDSIALLVRKITFGDLGRLGIQLPRIAPSRQLRETGQTPVIDLGTVDFIRSGAIKVKPAIEEFTHTGVLFTNGDECEYDAVIMATGYRAQLNDWFSIDKIHFDDNRLPRNTVGQDELQGIYFVGYNNYAPGGGLGIIRSESKIVVDHIAQN